MQDAVAIHEKLSETLQAAQEELDRAHRDKSAALSNFERAEKRKLKLVTRLENSEVQLVNLCQQVDEIQTRVNELKDTAEVREKELDDTESGVKQIKQHKSNMRTVETQVGGLNDKNFKKMTHF